MMLTQARLKEVLHYDPETGEFRRPKRIGSRGRVCGGHLLGHWNETVGYLEIRIDWVLYLAHRLAWFYMTGEWPDRVDHENRVKTDNRWTSLRNGTGSFNLQNRKTANSNNKSGYLGVTTDERRGSYSARIMLDGIGKHLGVFDTPEHAHYAYVKAKRELHPGCTI